MAERKRLERNLLYRIAEDLENVGFIVNKSIPEGEDSEEGLVTVVFNCAGDRADTHVIEISFLFLDESQINELGFHVFELFTCMKEDLPFTTCNELARAVLRINHKIPAGAFGIDEEYKALYYKSSCLITDDMVEETAFHMLQIHVGIFINILDYYNDILMDIIEGNRTAEEAIKKGLL